MSQEIVVQPQPRAWLEDSILQPYVSRYGAHLRRRRYAPSTQRVYLCCVAHFAHWLTGERCGLSAIGEAVVARFLSEHIPACSCRYPVRRLRHELRAALAQLLEVLRADGVGALDPASDTAVAQELARFDGHMRDVWGLDHLEKDRKNGARSRNARLAALRSFLKYAAHYDLTALPVIEQALAIPMKRFDRPVLGFLSRQEMQAILEAPDPRTWMGQRDRALFSLMYNTGARVSEVIGLRVGDVVIDGAMAVHLRGKGRKERSVPLWRSTASLIRSWKHRLEGAGHDKFLFPSRGGERMARSNVTQRLDLAVSAAAERHPQLARRSISPHTIRHSTAMHLLQSGVDITVIALWLGHESPVTTHMYLEADLSMKERTLDRLQPIGASPGRYRPPDQLMRFLQSL